MTSHLTLGKLADQIRSKNAGPFWVTIDIFLRNDQDYELAAAENFLTPELLSGLYKVPATMIRIFRMPNLRVIKISYPRREPQGSIHDRDMHAAHQFVPLMSVPVPLTGAAPSPSS